MSKFKLLLLIIIFFCGLYTSVQAQSIPQNLSNINVDDLSDAQVKQLMQNAESSGLSDAQLIQAAQARGMSATQVQRLQTRVTDIRRREGSTSGYNSNSLN